MLPSCLHQCLCLRIAALLWGAASLLRCSKPSRFTTGEPGRDVAAWEHLLWQLLIESYVVQVGMFLQAIPHNA
jgi:hypothetical protein